MSAYLLAQDPGPGGPLRPDFGEGTGITRTLTKGQSKTLQQLQLPAQHGGSFTLSLGLRSTPTVAQKAVVGVVDAPLELSLTFGLGGVVERVVADWLNGTLIQVPSGGITVSATYPSIVGSKDWTFEVSSLVMPAIRPPSAGIIPMARRTVRVASIAAGSDSARIGIPNRGHAAMMLLPTALAYGNLQINWDTNDGTSPAAGNVLTRTRPGGSEEQPIPNGAQSFTISNLGAAAIAPFLVFSLAL